MIPNCNVVKLEMKQTCLFLFLFRYLHLLSAPKFRRPLNYLNSIIDTSHYCTQHSTKTQQQNMDEEYRRNNKKAATTILNRTLHVEEKNPRKKSRSPPSTPPPLECSNVWYAEPRAQEASFTTPTRETSPSDLASRLALGVSESFNCYPDTICNHQQEHHSP